MALALLLAMASLASAVAQGEAEAVVHLEVSAARVTLGDLVPEMPAPWREVDLGPAPAPLQRRDIGAAEVAERVRRARLGEAPLAVPARARLRRTGTSISAPELQDLVRPGVLARLPAQAKLRSLSVANGVVVGGGHVEVEVAAPAPREGRQSVMARLRSADGVVAVVPALLDVELPRTRVEVRIERGQDVRVVVTAGSVVVRAMGVAQAAAALGESITVLPETGGRVLRGRVVDAQTVEVAS